MKNKKIIASVSFGKDSLAMLLKILEEKTYKIDEVVFYDTGMEFDAIYKIRDKIKEILKNRNIKYVELQPKRPFLYDMIEKKVFHRNGNISKGYAWCGGACRWGTTYKTRAIDNYCKNNIQLVGIAYDEPQRIARILKQENKIAPLVDFKMTEADCLKYCYSHGYDWDESGVKLYDVLDRVSCWCCANKNLKELANYKKYLPKYWNKLKDLQAKINRPFKQNMSVFEIEKRFEKESA